MVQPDSTDAAKIIAATGDLSREREGQEVMLGEFEMMVKLMRR